MSNGEILGVKKVSRLVQSQNITLKCLKEIKNIVSSLIQIVTH